jgi:hypothetical protein
MAGPGQQHEPKQGGNGKHTKEIKVRLTEQNASGVYANAMLVHHSGEEFVMDFSMVVGAQGQVVSRIVTSPAHMKRIVVALEENLRRYEAVHGPIKGASNQPPLILGFSPPAGGDN